ncbi:SLATT domain-containing protein [Proteus terrae subsp. cibarius]|uniref:SLATT domain-containing protein n=1 Tax=Proteus terrae subsp. cibarius TaxID=626774 RepID=A0ABX6JLN0_9GAMM|nr:SLATT domain-containing protein [Proteus terrae]QGW02888.1 SLATT domain-containing protein [Proteus terrae subsp. cibarius]QIF90098.1 SLATT domain-containing protein [Proteus terrae subsp. cibarius]HCZ8416649.1 SLATT domain-containing protein [Proteus mirabilis]
MALADNIWWTRKARIQTEKRLLSNAFHSQVILLWYSFFSVAVSVYYLNNPQNGIEAISWVVYSVLVLCISGFINGLSFKERANLIKECYESLNSIMYQASKPNPDLDTLSTAYESKLNACENHTDKDFAIALCQEYWASTSSVRQVSKDFHSDTSENKQQPKQALTRIPTSHHWFLTVSYFVVRLLTLVFFYVLPVLILLALNSSLFLSTPTCTG